MMSPYDQHKSSKFLEGMFTTLDYLDSGGRADVVVDVILTNCLTVCVCMYVFPAVIRGVYN